MPAAKYIILICELIDYSESVTYLRIKLDSKRHWRIHVNEKLDKAKNYLLKLANLTRNQWRPKPKLMRWVFTGIVRPMISYGPLVWVHEYTPSRNKF